MTGRVWGRAHCIMSWDAYDYTSAEEDHRYRGSTVPRGCEFGRQQAAPVATAPNLGCSCPGRQ
jgi:hypothetical protein